MLLLHDHFVHSKCIRKWNEIQRIQNNPPRCAMCRRTWDTAALCAVCLQVEYVTFLSVTMHCSIYTVRRMIILRERPRIIETRNYKTFDMNAFAEDLKKISWELLNRFHDPNEMWRM